MRMAKLLRWLHWQVVLPFWLPSFQQPVVAQYPPLSLSPFQKAQISSCRGPGVSGCGQVGVIKEISLRPNFGF